MKKVVLLFLIFFSQLVLADIQSDSDKLFNWAETKYPDLFSPLGQDSKTSGVWYYRYYPGTKNYVGVNTTDGDVYVLGDVFDGMKRIDTLEYLLLSMSTPEPEPEPKNTGDIDGECVTVNGAMWEVKTDDGGLRDKDNTYVWYDPSLSTTWVDSNTPWAGTPDGELSAFMEYIGKTWFANGSCTGDIPCDTFSYINAVNAQGLCGHHDWRMPTKNELLGLVEYKHLLPNENLMYYSSSTPAAESQSQSAWGIGFQSGNVLTFGKSLALSVRLVRTGQ